MILFYIFFLLKHCTLTVLCYNLDMRMLPEPDRNRICMNRKTENWTTIALTGSSSVFRIGIGLDETGNQWNQKPV